MSVKRFLLIRHGMTQGNLERRYLGNPEEPLCDLGIAKAVELMKNGELPPIDTLLSGPAVRCRETAGLLFPNIVYSICPMVEIDFGIFKGKNADELVDNKDYNLWLESYCLADIPDGDSVSAFKSECCSKFEQIVETSSVGTTAMIIHGGNIMSIMEHLAVPKKEFYDYHIPNCGFFLCRYENGSLFAERSYP